MEKENDFEGISVRNILSIDFFTNYASPESLIHIRDYILIHSNWKDFLTEYKTEGDNFSSNDISVITADVEDSSICVFRLKWKENSEIKRATIKIPFTKFVGV